MDALHIASAQVMSAVDFITVERKSKPLYRTTLVRVLFLDDVDD